MSEPVVFIIVTPHPSWRDVEEAARSVDRAARMLRKKRARQRQWQVYDKYTRRA